MKLTMIPAYEPITEKEYCCIPAVLQMIQRRRDLGYESQEEIGYQLGLIVAPEFKWRFSKVRTGPEPQAGYGTQTSKEEFSIPSYFRRNGLPLKFTIIQPQTINELRNQLGASLQAADDIIICYNSRLLFGDGDVEHVSLIQEFGTESGDLMVVDPAIGVPKLRKTMVDRLFKVINAHYVSNHGGLWIISAIGSNNHENQK